MISDGSACDRRSEVGFGEAIGDRRLNGTEGCLERANEVAVIKIY